MKPNPITIAIGTLLLIIFVLLLFLFQVRKTETAVVTTFGRVTSQAGPGAHFRWPWPIQSVHKVDRRIHNYESKLEQLYTSDGNNLLIMVFVGWEISDPAVFHTRFNADLHRAELALKPHCVVFSKLDLFGEPYVPEIVTQGAFGVYSISAPARQGLDTLRDAWWRKLLELMKAELTSTLPGPLAP